MINPQFTEARKARIAVAAISDPKRSDVLLKLSEAIVENTPEILRANALDLARMKNDNPLYDRLLLTEDRLKDIAADMLKVASLPSPLGKTLYTDTRPNGLQLRKVSVPYGVIGVIYEARPNVTFDVFSLCFKSGNVCILKGGKDAEESNKAAVRLIKDVLRAEGVAENAVNLLPASHEATAEMLEAVGYVDLVIPRGGRKLIDFVRNNSRVPCIETGAGVVNCYFHSDGDLAKGKAIVCNAKMRRVSVCNALDCLLVHSSRLGALKDLVYGMNGKVTIYADERAYETLKGYYQPLMHADESCFGTEFMDYKMAVRVVDSLDEALSHIEQYGSGHSECIITESTQAGTRFQTEVDAACVYVNAPTSFTDGAQFGLGAEIGISTQKLGARGPMGLNEMTSYKWLIDGNGQTRP